VEKAMAAVQTDGVASAWDEVADEDWLEWHCLVLQPYFTKRPI
jgi:hypothetical protein